MSLVSAKPFGRSMVVRVGVTIFATLSLLLAVLFFAVQFQLSASLEKRDHELIRGKLRQFVLFYDEKGLEAVRAEASRHLLADDPWLFVRIAGADGKTLFQHEPLHGDKMRVEHLDEHPNISPKDNEAWQLVEDPRDEDAVEVLSVALRDGKILQVGRSTDDRGDRIEQLRTVFLFSSLPVLALGFLGSFLVSRRIVKPIRNLIRTVQEVKEGAIRARVPAHTAKGELGELTQLFNRMLDRIEKLIHEMRATVDHVAHDIRTPLTSLRGTAEAALKSRDDLPLYRESLLQCVESSEQVLTIVTAVMDVSEAEAGVIRLKRERVGADKIMEQVMELYRFVAEEKQITLTANCALLAPLSVDRGQMCRVLANLLDNALKYTAPGGRVELEAQAHGEWDCLRVRDSGFGISEADLPRIWFRLFRGDESRSQRGLGLGLTLVKALVEAHGGTVRAQSVLGHGTTITVLLPRSVA